MVKKELAQALEIARSDESLEAHDHMVLHGLYLPSFKQVSTTIKVVARLMREMVCRFDGTIDDDELKQFAGAARHKIIIIG